MAPLKELGRTQYRRATRMAGRGATRLAGHSILNGIDCGSVCVGRLGLVFRQSQAAIERRFGQ